MNFLEEVKNKKEFRKLSDDLVSRVLVKVSEKYDVTEKKDQKKIGMIIFPNLFIQKHKNHF